MGVWRLVCLDCATLSFGLFLVQAVAITAHQFQCNARLYSYLLPLLYTKDQAVLSSMLPPKYTSPRIQAAYHLYSNLNFHTIFLYK
ncbi:hypothetical protein V8B55DRAFT_1520079 [Mucor lusitanicus]